MKEFIFDNVYLEKHGENTFQQAYFVSFEFLNDTVDNVKKWEEFFNGLHSGKGLILTLVEPD